MSSPSRSAGKLRAIEITTLSLMGTLIFAAKFALASLPNININAVLIILTTIFFGWKALYSVAIYVLLEGLIFGFQIWWICYVFIWPLLVAAAMLFRKNDSAVIWAVIAGFWGLGFGPLMYIPYFCILGGWKGFWLMWLNGIPFDLIHCAGNFTFTLALYRPLCQVMGSFLQKTAEP
ncbi:MAG: hypothetical protein IKF99_12180 [Oscillospiraceae bacterium]|nr:hypothetical protein [Oscillospiraceae bacterium]